MHRVAARAAYAKDEKAARSCLFQELNVDYQAEADKLRATAPKREDYSDDDSFLEAKMRFAERQGRNIAMLESRARQQRQTSQD